MSGVKKEKSRIKGRVIVVLQNQKTGKKRVIETENIVTNAGDLYYAERGALLTTGTPISPVPTNFTDTNGVPDMVMQLFNGASAIPAKTNDWDDMVGAVGSSIKAIDATYPKVNDGDSDNTGAGTDIITYRVSYLTSEANAADIADVILTNPSPAATWPLLMHAEFSAAFTKTSSDTLKVFVNHEMLGV